MTAEYCIVLGTEYIRTLQHKTLIQLAIKINNLDVDLHVMQDPHYHGGLDVDRTIRDGHVDWHGIDLFQNSSFYNFCLPQLPSS